MVMLAVARSVDRAPAVCADEVVASSGKIAESEGCYSARECSSADAKNSTPDSMSEDNIHQWCQISFRILRDVSHRSLELRRHSG